MRGEETETYALIEQYGAGQNTIYILPGSHNKYVFVDENSTILATSTTLSGELLNSIVNDTIVSSSVDHGFPTMEHYNLEMIQYGCEMHRKEGIDVHSSSHDFLIGLANSQNIIYRTMFSELYWKVISLPFTMQHFLKIP